MLSTDELVSFSCSSGSVSKHLLVVFQLLSGFCTLSTQCANMQPAEASRGDLFFHTRRVCLASIATTLSDPSALSGRSHIKFQRSASLDQLLRRLRMALWKQQIQPLISSSGKTLDLLKYFWRRQSPLAFTFCVRKRNNSPLEWHTRS